MTHISARSLILVALATVSSVPAVALAQEAGPSSTRSAPAEPRTGESRTPTAASGAAPAEPAPADTMSAPDRDALAAAQQLASEASQIIERWVTTQVLTEDRLFARMYFPIARTYPQKFTTPYDTIADRELVVPEDRVLTRSSTIVYAIVTDLNGYVPTHNTRFAQPLTGKSDQDYANNRTKRILGDLASLRAARSEAASLFQRTALETGDVIYDVSVPITVRGRHWGCARIGYRRGE